MKRQAKKARAIRQTRFDHWLIAIESLAFEFSDILDQPSADRERLWAIRLRELPDAVRSLEWAMKKAQMKALPLEDEQ